MQREQLLTRLKFRHVPSSPKSSSLPKSNERRIAGWERREPERCSLKPGNVWVRWKLEDFWWKNIMDSTINSFLFLSLPIPPHFIVLQGIYFPKPRLVSSGYPGQTILPFLLFSFWASISVLHFGAMISAPELQSKKPHRMKEESERVIFAWRREREENHITACFLGLDINVNVFGAETLGWYFMAVGGRFNSISFPLS